MNKADLIAFEKEIADRFERGEIRGPVHLSGGNEDQLIEIFQQIKPTDWVFSTWRSHYHALLHGVPPEKVMSEIMAGRSMSLMFPEHNLFTSAIVGGILPIAVGVAYALKDIDQHVWCFIGDMTACSGIFQESVNYAYTHKLPIQFIIENNGLSCNTPTDETITIWESIGYEYHDWPVIKYDYKRTFPHVGIGKWVNL